MSHQKHHQYCTNNRHPLFLNYNIFWWIGDYLPTTNNHLHAFHFQRYRQHSVFSIQQFHKLVGCILDTSPYSPVLYGVYFHNTIWQNHSLATTIYRPLCEFMSTYYVWRIVIENNSYTHEVTQSFICDTGKHMKN